jgi:NAD+ diphosphatase
MSASNYLDLALSRTELDRAAHLRSDSDQQRELWKRAKIALLLGDKFVYEKSHSGAGIGLRYFSADEIDKYSQKNSLPLDNSSQQSGERYFLGLSNNQTPYFVFHTQPVSEEGSSDFSADSLRAIGAQLSDLDIGVASHSLALSQWHYRHPRCAQCGAQTKVVLGGAARDCGECGAQHHPRTDPAVIVLVKDRADRILLGHQKVWPTNRFSTFAGFVEPGESFEQCVLREVKEEAGVLVTEMNYLGSQPWPFPASIMIAYEALIENPSDAKADGEEIEEIRWFTRESMKEAVRDQSIILPPSISVARAMINRWYGNGADRDLVGGEAWRS